jgi:hypothetical protein
VLKIEHRQQLEEGKEKEKSSQKATTRRFS